MDQNKKRILFISKFSKLNRGAISPAQNVAYRIPDKLYQKYFTSYFSSPFLKFFGKIWKIIFLKGKYDIAYLDIFSGKSVFSNLIFCFILKLLKKKIVLNLQGGNLPKTARKYKKVVQYLFKLSDYLVAPSLYLCKELSVYTNKPINIIPNPIDLKRYNFVQREKLKPNILWLRTIDCLYNPLILPKVIKILKEKYGDVYLKIAGPVKNKGYFKEINDLIDFLNVRDKIEYHGFIPKEKVPDFLQQGDIFLNTSNIDNHPVTVIEAMACGLCVVSTNVGGIPYLIENEKDGLLVEKNNGEAMANAIIRLLEDNSLSKNISFNARKKAEEFSWENIYTLWNKILDEI